MFLVLDREYVSMKRMLCPWVMLLAVGLAPAHAETIFQDDFDRQESDDTKEQVGNGWGTNSRSRAKGNKQVDLIDGAMRIERHPVADHGVSVTQDLEFTNARIKLRFQLGAKDDLGVNIADMKEKSVHAGHLCMARITANQVEIHDLKTGRMKLENREARKAGTLTKEQSKLIGQKSKRFKHALAKDQWHDLELVIRDDVLSVSIDGKDVGEFQSPGIAHPTKRRIRLAVNKTAWVDDVSVERL